MAARFAVSLGVWLLLVVVVAQAQVRFEQKVPQQTKQQTSINKKIAQTLTINNNDISSQVEEHALLESQSGKRGDDGLLPVEYRYTSWQVEVDVLGDKVRFDAADPDERNEASPIDVLLDPYRKMAGKPFTLMLDEDHQVVDLTGWDELTKDLDDKSAALHKEMFDPNYLRELWNAEFNRLPEGEVSVGDTWERKIDFRLHAGQSMAFTTQYKYVGEVEYRGSNVERIEMKTTKVEYRGADESQPLVVSESDLKVASSEGHLLFDRQRQQVVLVKEKLNVQGKLTFKITANDTELPGKLDLTMDIDSTLLP